MNLIKSSISFYKQQRNSWLYKLIGQLTVGTELHGFVSGDHRFGEVLKSC